MGKIEENVDAVLAMVGGTFIIISIILGDQAPVAAEYQEIFLDDVWHYGMIIIGFIIIVLVFILNEMKGGKENGCDTKEV